MRPHAPIGVMDSGVGGLSVVLALQKVLPYEDILYIGDTANCPYGNKTQEELLSLSGNLLSFLQENGVKLIALACNTTSALADRLRPSFNLPIISVAEAAADAIGQGCPEKIGLIATVSTVNSGIYQTRIRRITPGVCVESVSSVNLAALVEKNSPAAMIEKEIRDCMAPLCESGNVEDVILGCTHYPLVTEHFQTVCPGIRFLDPAQYQAAEILAYLQKQNAVNAPHRPRLTVCTTGETRVFSSICEKTGLNRVYDTQFLKIV